jgi:YD repeat-containing protein
MGATLSLTDPDLCTTNWTYDHLGQETTQSQVVALGYNPDGSVQTTTALSTFFYDADGNLSASYDPDGREIRFSYDTLNNETGETWYDDAGNVTNTVMYSNDVLGNLASASKTDDSSEVADYNYQYDTVGDVTSENIALAGMSTSVTLASQYDFNGNRTQFAATIGTSPDFLNTYKYDTLGDMTSVLQQGNGGNTVTNKYVTLSYDADQRVSSIDAYQSADTSTPVYYSTDGYNNDSQLTDLVFSTQPGGTRSILAGYHWNYNADGLVSREYSHNDAVTGASGPYSGWARTTFDYDNDGELTNTFYYNFANQPATNRADTYDFNGNCDTTTSTSGTADTASTTNRVLFDGEFYYLYDAAGNRIAKFSSQTGALDYTATGITTYQWDNRNELIAVKTFATFQDYLTDTAPHTEIDNSYGPFRELVTRTPTGFNSESTENFIYDGQNIALILNSSGGVIERELDGAAVDQVFASEAGSASTTLTAGTVDWYLADNQGSVRDVVQLSGGGTVVKDHIDYDRFGQVSSQSNAGFHADGDVRGHVS